MSTCHAEGRIRGSLHLRHGQGKVRQRPNVVLQGGCRRPRTKFDSVLLDFSSFFSLYLADLLAGRTFTLKDGHLPEEQ